MDILNGLNFAHIISALGGLGLLVLFGWVVRKHVPPPPKLASIHLATPVLGVACLAFATGSKLTVDYGGDGLKIEVAELRESLETLGIEYDALAQQHASLQASVSDLTTKEAISFASTNSRNGDIIEIASQAGQFQTLAAALEAADLVSTLSEEGPFTVFAPTDEAFAKLPEGTVEELLKPENKDRLLGVLSLHVAPGRIVSTGVNDIASITTVNGQNLTVMNRDGVRVDDARVVVADVNASNGVIHVIDTVILPN